MSFLFTITKLAALAAALLCLTSVGPSFLLADAEQLPKKLPTAMSHCRMYFGCVPVALVKDPVAEELQ